ncbi:hypothetical protein SAMN05216355_11228 [Actinomyces ruminicola]|uniref:DUF86 domain-containing protein n=1 Tax=Actinomyces ruminicola TaxID=332524 RepID=A0A1H0DV62_9ACTO|nr:hypothetical protein [Actinomyces ruminicola]SDN73871.1 hypothetical protein SAMN05216355_11228 [Actinomyces ruminicola]
MSTTPSPADRLERRLADLRRFGNEAAFVVEQLPQSYKKQFPHVGWVGIMRMRNLITHHRDRVNDDLMFHALATRVPTKLARLGP